MLAGKDSLINEHTIFIIYLGTILLYKSGKDKN